MAGTRIHASKRKEPSTSSLSPLDPEIKKHLDLALTFLEEGKNFVERNPVQASENSTKLQKSL